MLDDHLRIIKLLLDLVTRLKSQDCRAKARVLWVNGRPEPPSETLSRKKKGRQGSSVGKKRLPHKPGNLSLSPKSYIKVEGEKPAPLTSRYSARTHVFTSLSASVGRGGIHVYKLPWVCARLWGSACAHRDQSLPSHVLLFGSYSRCLAMLVGQWMPGSVDLCLPRAETAGGVVSGQFLCGFWESEFRIFLGKHFTDWIISPNLI